MNYVCYSCADLWRIKLNLFCKTWEKRENFIFEQCNENGLRAAELSWVQQLNMLLLFMFQVVSVVKNNIVIKETTIKYHCYESLFMHTIFQTNERMKKNTTMFQTSCKKEKNRWNGHTSNIENFDTKIYEGPNVRFSFMYGG